MYDLLIVGGGAAGMMAAVQAGRRGLRVLLAEKGEKETFRIVRETIVKPRYHSGAGSRF